MALRHYSRSCYRLPPSTHPSTTDLDCTTVLILHLFHGNKEIILLPDKLKMNKQSPTHLFLQVDKLLPFQQRNPPSSFLKTTKFSAKFNQLFEVYLNEFHHTSFQDDGLRDNILTKLASFNPKRTTTTTVPQCLEDTPVPVNLALVNKAASYSEYEEDCDLNAIRSTVSRIRSGSSSDAPNTNSNKYVPMLDIAKASDDDIIFLLKLFKTNVPSTFTNAMRNELSSFIPTIKVKPSRSHECTSICTDCSVVNSCSLCLRECCQHNPLQLCYFPRTGLTRSSALCSDCVAHNILEDANDWAEASLKYLSDPNAESITAAIGCALIAIALGFNSLVLLRRIAKRLHSKGISGVAYSILNLAMMLLGKEDDAEQAKLYFCASSIIKDLVNIQGVTKRDKFTFSLASMEAFYLALKAWDRNSVEMPYINSDDKGKQVERTASQVLEERIQERFKEGSMQGLLTDLAYCLDAASFTEKSIHPERLKTPFQGVIRFYLDLLKSIKADIPSLPVSEMVRTGYIDSLIPQNGFCLPSDEELIPKLESWLPMHSWHIKCEDVGVHFSLISIQLKKFEEEITRFFQENKWSCFQVAGAYIDIASECNDPAEKAISYLRAAMWMMRDLISSDHSLDVLYAHKSVIMDILLLSCETAMYRCNPGMELCVTRLAVGIIKKITTVPNSQRIITKKDLVFVETLLQRITEVGHVCPLWNIPPFSLHEACWLNRSLQKAHSTYVFDLQLQHKLPQNHDIAYYLYQNDIRNILPLKNSSECRARAMDELLKSQDLVWNDVRQSMSTSLCPRDEDGWLIQSPHLGISQQYSKLIGFILDTDKDNPLVTLLVVKASPETGVNGLFSDEDIKTMLLLDPDDESLYFSLDQPSSVSDISKAYHPFMQWRNPEKIKGTEVLNTMFITDYLLKSFATDIDISSVPPFKQRPCKEGLTKNLPSDLQKAIRPIRERPNSSQSSRNRLWIESKDVKYTKAENGSRQEYYFDEVEMEVKCQPCPFGVDAISAGQDSPDSTVSFAKDMTDHYSELSHHFPVFSRLRELSKLQFFASKLQKQIAKLSPENASSLTQLIKKHHKSRPLPNCKPTWVPAVTSPYFLSIHYGGVKLVNGGVKTKSPYSWPFLRVSQVNEYITGCYGDEFLQKTCKNVTQILNESIFKSLNGIMKIGQGGIRCCEDTIRGLCLLEVDSGGSRKLEVRIVNDAFKHMSGLLKTNSQYKHFGCVEFSSEANDMQIQRHINAFCQNVYDAIGDQLSVQDCLTSQPISFNPLKGVRLSKEGILCQDTEERKKYTYFSEVNLSELSNSAVNLSELSNGADNSPEGFVTYSPPVGKAEKQANRSDERFKHWNTVNTSQNEETKVSIMQYVMDDMLSMSAEERITPSIFRLDNSELNKPLERLYTMLIPPRE